MRTNLLGSKTKFQCRLMREARYARAKLLLLALGLVLSAPAPADPNLRTVAFAKGRVLVQPRAGLSDKELDKLLKPYGGQRKGHLKQINVHIIELAANANEIAVMQALSKNPHLKFAELDEAVPPELIPNDPYYGNAWHLPKIGAPGAWDASTGLGVTIAILDTGVDATHPDLIAALVPGWNTYDNNSLSGDVHGHGTAVAGAAAASGANAVGVAGVAWRARIMPIRVTDTSGYGYYSTIASGINWAADHGARVANVSFAGIPGSSTIASAAQYLRGKGGVVVVAAGNSGIQEPYAANPYLTVAGATDSADAKASFSSFGAFVDVGAPGVSIWTTARGGSYGSGSGTSFASPVTAGVYALMIAANANLAPGTLDSLLFSTARDLGTAGFDPYFGYGRVDAGAAVAAARAASGTDTTAPSVSISSPSAGARVSGLLPVNVSASDNVGVARVELYLNNTLFATDTTAPYGFSVDTLAMADGSLTLMARAFDAAGNATSSANVALTIANDTTPPTVVITSPANGATVSGIVTITASATDDQKVSRLSLLIDGREVAMSFGSAVSHNWNTASGRKKSNTTSTITARALDPAGNLGTASITVRRH